MDKKQFALGLDYGTGSVRALIVDIVSGEEVASAVAPYASGVDGVVVDPGQPLLARQNPADWLAGLRDSVRTAIAEATKNGFTPDRLAGIGIDTTGSTPVPVDEQGNPLSFQDRFRENPAAMAWLWKDHTSFAEAEEISTRARESNEPYLTKCGGVYSSEWFWAKALHFCRTEPDLADAAGGWVELADYIPGVLVGQTRPEKIVRSLCAAGHKGLWHRQWGGWPSRSFLTSLHPQLARWCDGMSEPQTSDRPAGFLSPEWSESLGLLPNTPVATGGFDAHFGAVGAGIRPGCLVKIIGTSTCDIMVAPLDRPLGDIPGLCGIVPGSVLPDMYGLEAGQSAVGDIFNWFVKNFSPAGQGGGHAELMQQAARLKPGQSGLVALDWNNGNRTILTDPLLSGLMLGTTLHTTAAEYYRALIEATAFGALTIINQFERYGVAVAEVLNCGGIAEKNPLLMQIYADVCNRPMRVTRSSQTCALGAAIFGAVAGKAYSNVADAQRAMAAPLITAAEPCPAAVPVYARLYRIYKKMHDAFGCPNAPMASLMKELIAIREAPVPD
ncbi:MAG: ribulokinase [Planctomycetia bacterium]|nr:ribulokinase [Planctomycetia bacterium]